MYEVFLLRAKPNGFFCNLWWTFCDGLYCHTVSTVSNCCLSVYLNTAGLWRSWKNVLGVLQSRGKVPEFVSMRVGTLYEYGTTSAFIFDVYCATGEWRADWTLEAQRHGERSWAAQQGTGLEWRYILLAHRPPASCPFVCLSSAVNLLGAVLSSSFGTMLASILLVSSFSALTLLVGSFDPLKPVPDMTYNVFGGTLSLTQSIYYRYC